MSNPTILCVDDERNVLLTLRTQLMRHFPNHVIEIAESGDEALELVDELRAEGVETPLVIADQIMPGMQGDELLIELHARHPEILKVMLTGQARAEDVGNVVNRGNLYRFIAKPWSETDLTLTVTEALRCFQQEQLIAQQQAALTQTNLELEALNADLENQVQERTQQLQSNQQQLQLFVHHTPAAVAMFDREMRYLLASQRWKTDYNLGDQDIIGRSHYDVFPTIPDHWKAINQRCLAGASERSEEDCFTREDGSVTWNQWEIHPWYTETNDIGGIIMFTQVITDRKQAELALQQLNAELEQRVEQRTQELAHSEQDLRTIFNNVYDAIFIHALDGTILDVNNPATEMFGASRAQLLVSSIPDLLSPDAPFERISAFHQQAQTAGTASAEWQARRLDNGAIFDI